MASFRTRRRALIRVDASPPRATIASHTQALFRKAKGIAMPLHLVQYSYDDQPNYRKQRVRTQGTEVGVEAVPEVIEVLKLTHKTDKIDVATIRTLDPRPEDDRELPVPPANYPGEITSTPGYTESPSKESDQQPESAEAVSDDETNGEPEPETKPTSARKKRRSRRT